MSINEKIKYFCVNLVSKISFPGLADRIFNRSNINKVFIIFIFGFVSRVLVNHIYDINVFREYTETISLVYYALMSLFIILVNEFVGYFEFTVIPLFVINSGVCLWNLFVKFITFTFTFLTKPFIYLFNSLPLISFEALKISSIRKALANSLDALFDNDKITISSYSNNSKVLDNHFSDDKLSGVLFKGDKKGKVSVSSGGRNKDDSAALGGLYDKRSGRHSGNKSNTPAGVKGLYSQNTQNVLQTESNNIPLIYRVKRRLIWYSWKQFSNKYSSFADFKLNWDYNIGVRNEIIKDIKKLLSK